ncbi:NAD(P)H-dependent oxidoreductase [Bosea sp. TND4EK4]|uniref:flavodoxin family protein n=1 Tax=Bosea sp. TND4EK4 TaxID=1907408 RepID=UPI000955826A|nr:NAD(P)H-dependent oxidoreductase [Bosea sp. TND4EK4]SIQ07635.1 Multimeric flavodoxin WrbA [Bosea sp. TND4EK4]
MSLSILALNCTLKPEGSSSTQKLLELVLAEFGPACRHEIVRVAALDIKPGVSSDEGDGDAWPELRRKIVAADILLIGSPIWLGQPSSVAKRVLERMDAFLDETDDANRTPAYGKVAAVVVVGNEDGAHHVSAELYQALVDVGFTIPAGGPSYWVGEAMGDVDFLDLEEIPEKTATTNRMLARNAEHLAGLLANSAYPGY